MEEFFVFPEATPGSEPSWFGFPIAVRPEAPFSRNQATAWLEERNIATRLLFGGNLVLDNFGRFLARRSLKWYERHAAWIFPALDIRCHLSARK